MTARRQCRKMAFLGACALSFLFCGIFGNLKTDQKFVKNFGSADPQDIIELIGQDAMTKVSELQCDLFFHKDNTEKSELIKRYTRQRIGIEDPPTKTVISCASIQRRWKFATESSSRGERDFPIAFARTVFKDYTLLEEMLAVEYQPQNAYCYALDSKADPSFKQRVRNLSKCFPNIVVADVEYSVESNGKNVTSSHFSCLEALRSIEIPWKYVVLLQNHDIPLKTNREMVEILKIFNGTNDISTLSTMSASIDQKLNWTFAHLQFYRDQADDRKMHYEENGKTLRRVRHTKSLVLAELSRRAVEFLLDKIDVQRFVNALERADYGMDEVVMSTLNSNLPDMPGGFTPQCLYDKKRPISGVGRYTVWKRNVEQCKSGKFRHFSCVFGVEDLEHLSSNKMTQLYFNKLMPSFDYGAVHCWLKHLADRNKNGAVDINTHYYRNLPHVRYNRWKINGSGKFECR